MRLLAYLRVDKVNFSSIKGCMLRIIIVPDAASTHACAYVEEFALFHERVRRIVPEHSTHQAELLRLKISSSLGAS